MYERGRERFSEGAGGVLYIRCQGAAITAQSTHGVMLETSRRAESFRITTASSQSQASVNDDELVTEVGESDRSTVEKPRRARIRETRSAVTQRVARQRTTTNSTLAASRYQGSYLRIKPTSPSGFQPLRPVATGLYRTLRKA